MFPWSSLRACLGPNSPSPPALLCHAYFVGLCADLVLLKSMWHTGTRAALGSASPPCVASAHPRSIVGGDGKPGSSLRVHRLPKASFTQPGSEGFSIEVSAHAPPGGALSGPAMMRNVALVLRGLASRFRAPQLMAGQRMGLPVRSVHGTRRDVA